MKSYEEYSSGLDAFMSMQNSKIILKNFPDPEVNKSLFKKVIDEISYCLNHA